MSSEILTAAAPWARFTFNDADVTHLAALSEFERETEIDRCVRVALESVRRVELAVLPEREPMAYMRRIGAEHDSGQILTSAFLTETCPGRG